MRLNQRIAKLEQSAPKPAQAKKPMPYIAYKTMRRLYGLPITLSEPEFLARRGDSLNNDWVFTDEH